MNTPPAYGLTSAGIAVPLRVDASGQIVLSALPALITSTADIGRVNGRGGDKLASMSGRLSQQVSNLNAAAGQNTVNGSAVPAGEIWHVTHVSLVNGVSGTTRQRVFFNFAGGQLPALDVVAAIAAGAYVSWDGLAVLVEGDYVQGVFTGCTLNDDLFVSMFGWKETA